MQGKTAKFGKIWKMSENNPIKRFHSGPVCKGSNVPLLGRHRQCIAGKYKIRGQSNFVLSDIWHGVPTDDFFSYQPFFPSRLN